MVAYGLDTENHPATLATYPGRVVSDPLTATESVAAVMLADVRKDHAGLVGGRTAERIGSASGSDAAATGRARRRPDDVAGLQPVPPRTAERSAQLATGPPGHPRNELARRSRCPGPARPRC